MRGAGVAVLGALAAGIAGCGGDSDAPAVSDDRGAGVGALGGGAGVETLARTRLSEPPKGELAWVADEIRLEPGEQVDHAHELAFAYARRGETRLDGEPLAAGAGAAIEPDARHTHAAAKDGAVLWEIRLAAPDSPPPRGARRVFASETLEGIPRGATASFLLVTVPPRGGRTTVHTHPGPEFIYQLSGRFDYQNAIIGTERLGPGGAEAIPPDTAVQKRNPLQEPAAFLSWFLVDPGQPFAPKASF
jgi:quercetin dioxygenase-like cupin family protein